MLNYILLEQGNAAAANAGGGAGMWIMILAMIVIFYFFMIRPQSKKQKEMKKFREALKAGDNVVTAGGIHGKIRDVKQTTFVIEIAKDTKITIDKAMVYPSVQDVESSGANPAEGSNK